MKKLLLTLGLLLMVSAVAFSQTQVLSGDWGGIKKQNITHFTKILVKEYLQLK